MNGFNAFYFSFVTLRTAGYGAVHTRLKDCALACGHGGATTGLLYVAVLIARLVSLYSSPKSDDS